MTALLLSSWLLCQSFDLVTTHRGLQSGFAEGNPVLRGKRGYVLKVGVNVALFSIPSARKSKGLPIIMAGAGCAAGAYNLHRLRGAK